MLRIIGSCSCHRCFSAFRKAGAVTETKRPRGFAAMDFGLRKELAAKGGRSVPREARTFARDPVLAAEAGRKGGRGVAKEDRSFCRDPSLAVVEGRIGGSASGRNFANDRDRAAIAGRKGGTSSRQTAS